MPEQNSLLVGRDANEIARVAQLDANGFLVVSAASVSVVPVPAADSADNAYIQDVVGNKEDAASDTANTASLVALARYILEEAEEIDHHFHNVERWWGATGAPDETNAIDANVNRPFVVASGNNDWGTAIPIKGTADNPVLGTMTTFDAHRILVTDLDDDTTPWRLRLIWGTGTSGAAITAGQWSEVMVVTNAVPGNRAGGAPADIRMPPVALAMKLWAQAWNDTNLEELSFFWGAHGYPY